jgi:hypothetical protein
MLYWFEERPTNKVMRSKLAQCIAQRLDMIGVESANSSTGNERMLDYACGTGFLSRVSMFDQSPRKFR